MGVFEQLPIIDNEDIEIIDKYYKTYETKETEDFMGKYKIGKPMGGWSVGDKNLCILDSGGMSECSATTMGQTKEKLKSQIECKFFEKATFANRCMYETFDSFCWNTFAQRAVKGI